MGKSSSPSPLASVIIVLVGLPFLVAGLFMTWLYLSPMLDWWQVRSWEEIPCQVKNVTLVEEPGKNPTYEVEATYSYTYRGIDHTSDQVNASFGADNMTSYHREKFVEIIPFAQEVVEAGKTIGNREDPPPYRCFVNPGKPTEAVLDTYLRWQPLAFLPLFALTFPALGFFLVFSPLLFRNRKARQNPNSIPDGDSSIMLVLAIYTAWAAIIILPLLFTVYAAGIFREEPSSLFLLIYAAPLLLLSFKLLRSFLRRKQIGRTSLELDHIPVESGSILSGHIATQSFPKLSRDPELTLSCSKTTTTGTGKRKRRITEVLWTETTGVSALSILRDVGLCKIPVRFTIPPGAPPSGKEGRVEHSWRLTMVIPGTKLNTLYGIPVAPATGTLHPGITSNPVV